MRDILLIKCKTAIEELHVEIDDTNHKKCIFIKKTKRITVRKI